MNDFLKLSEDLDWSYNVSDTPNERGEVCVELEKYSPQDQDFIATIWFENENEQDFIDKLRNYWEDYDYLRMEIEEMADRFKEQVRNKLEQSFLNR